MDRTLRYLLYNFATSFISLFGTLFLIVSIIFFIKISSITYIISVNFLELGKMYLFSLPRILLFTLPLSFFIALAISLFRLSKENETTVLFTLGYAPKNIGRFFIFLAFLLSCFLLLNALALVPMADQLSVNFIDFKKSEAKINLKPSKSGQKFSNWIVLIGDIEDINGSRNYKDIVLYEMNEKDKKERFVISKGATLINKKGELNLHLKDGSAYDLREKSINEAKYESMLIKTGTNSNIREVGSIFEYWSKVGIDKKRTKFFSLFVLIALFPLATVLFAPSFGIVTYRYNHSEIYGYLFAVIFGYFAATISLTKYYPFAAIVVVFGVSFAVSLYFFKKKIISFF